MGKAFWGSCRSSYFLLPSRCPLLIQTCPLADTLANSKEFSWATGVKDMVATQMHGMANCLLKNAALAVILKVTLLIPQRFNGICPRRLD